jgi:hypothetical protein
MFDLCKYKNMFGEPRIGIRKYRIFDIAIFDTVITVWCVYVLSWLFKWPFWSTLVIVLLLGIFVHKLFCVRTGVAMKLFPDST